MQAYGLFFLVAVAIGGVAWVFIYPFLSGERHAEKRMASVARSEPAAARPTRVTQKSRRDQVEGSLKELEERQKKAKRVPLSIKLTQAGLDWSKRRFMVTAGTLGVVAFLVAMLLGAGLLPALGFGFAAGCGIPLWLLKFLKKRRESKFLNGFPDAVDVVVQAARLRDGSRRITHITEVMGMEGDVIVTQDIFTYEILGEDAKGNLMGKHKSTGIGRPKFWERARYYGEEARLAAALDAADPTIEAVRG